MPSTIRVGLLDADPDVRFGRRLAISSRPDLEVVYESDGLNQDLEAIERSLIDVLVIDQKLSFGSGIAFYSNLRDQTGVKQAPKAIMTASFEQPALLHEALQQGIFDVVSIEHGASGLLECVARALSGVDSHSLSSIKGLVNSQLDVRAVDVNFVRLVDDLPEKLASNLRRLKSIWQSEDPEELEKYELGVLSETVSRLPVSNAVELILALNRSGLLDVK